MVHRDGPQRLRSIAPQFLVDDLERSTAFYRNRLGFTVDFIYQGFYAGVSRDGIDLHLKCAPKTAADRDHRHQNEHLDAMIGVEHIDELYDEFKQRQVVFLKALSVRPWSTKDFYVEDPDGYIVCFSERIN